MLEYTFNYTERLETDRIFCFKFMIMPTGIRGNVPPTLSPFSPVTNNVSYPLARNIFDIVSQITPFYVK